MGEECYQGYDHVFGHRNMGQAADAEHLLHRRCVEPMLDRLFCGENCSILAYGQTGEACGVWGEAGAACAWVGGRLRM